MSMVADKYTFQAAVAQLANRIKMAVGMRSQLESKNRFALRLETQINPVDPLLWLASQNCDAHTYWRGRDGDFEMAGVGAASVCNQISEINTNCNDDLRYFGGLRFDTQRPPEEQDAIWKPFAASRFVLPRFELIAEPDRHTLVCNLLVEELTAECLGHINHELSELSAEHPWDESAPLSQVSRVDNPDQQGWASSIANALQSIKAGRLEKIVLARRSDVESSHNINPWQLLAKLRETTEACTLFGIQPEPGAVFVGATPERLYARHGDQIKSEAIAGTRPRGTDSKEDERLADELTASIKDNVEHQYVVKSIAGHLEALSQSVTVAERPHILKLARVQHLKTDISARLNDHVSDADLVNTLHPTPAVGGVPDDLAREEIAWLEPFDRGWYAGPVGWVGSGRSEFAVAIRSALVADNRLMLFGGAGIVNGSTAEYEWQEIEYKTSLFVSTLTDENK